MLNMTKPQLCYSVHGEDNQWFNLVTDRCITVNALYTSLNEGQNIITKIGVKAVDDYSECVEILVDSNQCSVSIDGRVIGMESYSSGNINVRKYSKHAHISVPNCDAITLIMWVICEQHTILSSNVMGDVLKFVVLRGLNYGNRETHGLLGKLKTLFSNLRILTSESIFKWVKGVSRISISMLPSLFEIKSPLTKTNHVVHPYNYFVRILILISIPR